MNWLHSMLSLLCTCFIISNSQKARESHLLEKMTAYPPLSQILSQQVLSLCVTHHTLSMYIAVVRERSASPSPDMFGLCSFYWIDFSFSSPDFCEALWQKRI
jgi:hypothetical protein